MKNIRTVAGAAVAAVGLAVVVVVNSPRSSTLALHTQVSPPTTSTIPASSTVTSSTSAPTATPGSSASTTTTTSSTSATSSVLGSNQQFSYGSFAVKLITSGSKVTDVVIVDLHPIDAFSTQLDDQAFPVLRQQVLAAQSAQIQGVSGASYTTQAYITSLQAALNKLHS